MTAADVVVIGGGPAGLSCATAARRCGLTAMVVESMALGGQLINIAELDDSCHGMAGQSGWDFAADLAERAQDNGVRVDFATVEKVERFDEAWRILGAGLDVVSEAVVLATGTIPTSLPVIDAERFCGLGLSACAACDGHLATGRVVAVIGGGDIARWEAEHLASFAKRVLVLTPVLNWRLDRALPTSIEVIEGAQVVSVEGSISVEGLHYEAGGRSHFVALEAIFNGLERSPVDIPLTDAERDDAGALRVDDDLATTAPGLLAIGDVRSGSIRRIGAAIADGERAAAAVANQLDR